MEWICVKIVAVASAPYYYGAAHREYSAQPKESLTAISIIRLQNYKMWFFSHQVIFREPHITGLQLQTKIVAVTSAPYYGAAHREYSAQPKESLTAISIIRLQNNKMWFFSHQVIFREPHITRLQLQTYCPSTLTKQSEQSNYAKQFIQLITTVHDNTSKIIITIKVCSNLLDIDSTESSTSADMYHNTDIGQ